MRINIKRQLMELISTIEEGIDYISINGNNHSPSMIQDCYESLQALSSVLSNEIKVVKLIQRAMEKVQAFDFNQSDDLFNHNINHLKGIIYNIKSSIIIDIKNEFEIVFFPYNSSMWDSLESIYNEAMKDPDCTCYVVPIPYYEKNKEGEITRFCYEGNQFPKNVHTIPFELYDFENRRPDIVYIHNPYDSYNTLTMVNPRFFSENLAKYTDMLVYVPYFVAGCTETLSLNIMPSYIYANKLIVQSTHLKDAYIYSGIEQQKILDLGSPKIDAMLTAVREGLVNIPMHWNQIIKNRKVFLLNTGIADLLSSDMWFDRLVHILNCFIENDKNILIWRPHPLTQITLKTMRPHLVNQYEEIERNLKQATNIIIDNNSDVYPAIIIADAIISDYSSIMLQSIITEKPILGILDEGKTASDLHYYADYLGCYFADQDLSVTKFIEMIENNEDLRKTERITRFKKSLSNTDGTCGMEIHTNIKNEVLKQMKHA
ncbi:CDP-glycerol glycerophosphotransferase family protein [Paenibacillus polygoni]|uniref:CDP-glycerol glycerophosphotransferase family protein n=1 Tax=Paenibacillus polygoni TaxID=3050112 RepID=A0ABY8X1I8_9BACL|nr:CDP-glycerol glycerophosphotransferase family protein [Paenibacillus polygoni]WIV18898.1 CDP-glycerol glycerophosphotransferase family protein [Paenibacillus polygoni]